MNEPIITIQNTHSPDCGVPLQLRNNVPGQYLGYFENAYGDQWLFVATREDCKAVLYSGDIGWDEPIAVVDGVAEGTKLSDDEGDWVQACWRALVKFKPE